MVAKQLSIFLENKSGRLTEVTEVLAKENINLSALCIAENADFGILRGIVSDPDRAYKALKDNHFAVPVCHCRHLAFARAALGCGVPQPHIDFELARKLCDGIGLSLDGYSAHEWRKAVLVLSVALDVEQHFHFCFHALLF